MQPENCIRSIQFICELRIVSDVPALHPPAMILSYITFKKQSAPANGSDGFNLRAMHTINKISILMFLVGLVVLIIKMAT